MGDYSRLNAFDRFFLDIEDRAAHMHIAATCVFDAGPLARADGSIDVDRIRRYVQGRLGSLPRYRQRLAYVPLENHPVWVDDYRFDLRYHVRHLSLPRPGDARQLKRMIAWIVSQQLDRDRPLWEMWIIEGLEDNRFAVCQKIHHCMIDGLAGVEEMSVLLDPDPSAGIDIPRHWQPRPAPAPFELARDAVVRRMTAPVSVATSLVDSLWRAPLASATGLRDATVGLGALLGDVVQPGADLPFNRTIGAQRRFDWTSVELEHVKAVKNALGGTVNDVVLATVTGALRRFMLARGVSGEELSETRVRVMCPVNRRGENGRSTIGNKVAGMLVELPVGEDDATKRLSAVLMSSARGKTGHQADASVALASMCDWTMPSLLSTIERAAIEQRIFNLVVTNIPGPPFPLYLLGSRMVETLPLVPLFPSQGLAIAVFSYAGKLFWGFNADRDVVPALHEIVSAVEEAFAELAAAAGVDLSPPADVVNEAEQTRRARTARRRSS